MVCSSKHYRFLNPLNVCELGYKAYSQYTAVCVLVVGSRARAHLGCINPARPRSQIPCVDSENQPSLLRKASTGT